MGRAQRKKIKLPPSFYIQQSARLAAEGKTKRKDFDNTTKCSRIGIEKVGVVIRSPSNFAILSLTKPPFRFCDELGYNPRTSLQNAQVPDFKMFWKWTVDHYNKINVASSLRTYWRVPRMHALDVADRDFDPRERRDIRNVRCW